MVFDLPKEQSSIIKVIGVGGGGSNAVNYMFSQGIRGVNFVICNTDSQALESSPIPNKIQLGPFLTEGLGAGADPEVGKRAAEESIEDIKKILEKNTKMVFITAGMGGGTGTGGAPVVAKIAKEMGILTVGIVTRPFRFEGKKRINNAEEGIEAIRKYVDSLIIISNDRVLEIYKNLKSSEAFGKANDILTTAARSTSEIITYPGQINVDFADVQSVMRSGGVALMGHAIANGEDRAYKAVEQALNSPLLNDNNIFGAKKVLINIIAGKGDNEMSMSEIEDITTYVQTAAGETADVFFGTSDDEALGDGISVTVIATGFEVGSVQQNITRKDIVQTNTPVVIEVVVEQPVATETAMVVEENIFVEEPVATITVNETLVVETPEIVSEEVMLEEVVLEETAVLFEEPVVEEVIAETETVLEDELLFVEESVVVNEVVNETIIEEFSAPVIENEVVVAEEKIVYELDTNVIEEEPLLEENLIVAENETIVNELTETPFVFNTEVSVVEEEVVAEETTTIVDETNATIFEFEFDNNIVAENETVVEQETITEEPVVQSDLFGSMTVFTKEDNNETAKETNTVMQNVQQTTYERMRQLEKLSNRLNNPSTLNELESVPAYKRKMIQLDFSQPSSQSSMSDYSYNRNEDGTFEIRKNNPHINDIVD
jgi:cell division protein FtsZ